MLIKCPECGKEISDKAAACPNCGFPLVNKGTQVKSNHECISDQVKRIASNHGNNPDNKFYIIQDLMKETSGMSHKEAKRIVDEWFDYYKPNIKKQSQSDYHVTCPRCGGQNITFYFEENYIPGKTKVRYSLNLNPFRPFTLFNEKEKVIKRPKTIRTKKAICNDCGNVF